jgi:hypothetical protein
VIRKDGVKVALCEKLGYLPFNSAGINDPEGPEKYNNTEVKYGANLWQLPHGT